MLKGHVVNGVYLLDAPLPVSTSLAASRSFGVWDAPEPVPRTGHQVFDHERWRAKMTTGAKAQAHDGIPLRRRRRGVATLLRRLPLATWLEIAALVSGARRSLRCEL